MSNLLLFGECRVSILERTFEKKNCTFEEIINEIIWCDSVEASKWTLIPLILLLLLLLLLCVYHDIINNCAEKCFVHIMWNCITKICVTCSNGVDLLLLIPFPKWTAFFCVQWSNCTECHSQIKGYIKPTEPDWAVEHAIKWTKPKADTI